MMRLKQAAKWILPPVLLLPFRPRVVPDERLTRFVEYPTWGDAVAAAGGYQSDAILDIQRAAMRKVRDGEAVYERDSVLFDKIEYSFPLLATLLSLAARNNGRLSVLDFGGALGSSYYQNRGMLSHLSALNWHVVEQPHFVAAGREEFENGQLRFFPTLEASWQASAPDIVLLSSVLQYLDSPFALLAEISRRAPPFILVDRTPVLDSGAERAFVQIVPAFIYPATYACRLFAPGAIETALADCYDLGYGFDAIGMPIVTGDARARYRGSFFERRKAT